MALIIINLVKMLLVEGVVKAVATAALKSGVKMARIGAQSSTNKIDDAIVDGVEEAAHAVLNVWNGKEIK